ncbi:MAG: NosD domain-containing protein [Candidatus Lokiarchaeia archaeon]
MAGLKEEWLRFMNMHKIIGDEFPEYIAYQQQKIYNALEDVHSVGSATELQEAIDNIGTGAGTIFIESGTYTINTPIDIDGCGSLVIYGHGDNTILQATDGVTVFNITCCQSLLIKTLKIDINNYTLLHPNTQVVIVNETNNNVVGFSDVTIDGDGSNGIGIELQSNNCYIDQCNITDCKKGVYINNSDNHNITNNIFTGHKEYGIHLDTASKCSINGNTLNSITSYGIYADTCSYNTFSLNISNSNYSGIFIRDSLSNTISSNTCNSNSHDGIHLIGSNYNTISSNTCDGNDSNAVTDTAGIFITNDSDYNTITGNSSNNNNNTGVGGAYGIVINTATCEENIIASNNCNGNDIDYKDSGARTTVEYYVQNVDELQDAINSIGSKAGIINIKSSFTVNATIVIDGNGSYLIEGEGDNTVLTTVGDIKCFDIDIARQVVFKNFKIDASSLTTATKEIIDVNENNNNLIIFDNVSITGDGSNGIGIELNSNNCRINNCNIENVNIGVNILSMDNMLQGNKSLNCNTYGIKVGANNNMLNTNTCSSNVIGIYINSANNSLIIGNYYESNTEWGIYLIDSNYNSIPNNYCLNNDGNSANPIGGIGVDGDSDNNMLIGNTSINNNNTGAEDGYGIYLGVNTDNNHILANWLSGNDDNQKDLGNNTTFSIAGHLHDGETLQLDGINSDGGAFDFLTTGQVNFNQNLNLKDGSLLAGLINTVFSSNWSGVVDKGITTDKVYDQFVEVANEITALKYCLNFEGVWDASSGNPPDLTPADGDYWITTTAGNWNGVDWELLDWIVWEAGSAKWYKVKYFRQFPVVEVSGNKSIQTAIDQIIYMGGGIVKIHSGTYNDGNDVFPLTINDGGNGYFLKIIGVGDTTILDPNGDSTIFSITNIGKLVLEDFKIDANDLTTATKEIINIAEASNNPIIVRSITIIGNGTNGYGIEINSNNCKVENCDINSINIGINVLGNDNTIQENIINSCNNYGIQIKGNKNSLYDNESDNNSVGIYLDTADYNQINGNYIEGNTLNGIYLTGSNYNALNDNYCIGNDSNTANPQAGIYITGDSDNNTIISNTSINNNNAGAGNSYGIYIANANSNNNIIKSNSLTGNDVNWKDNGTNTEIEYRCSTGAEIQQAIDSIAAKSGVVHILPIAGGIQLSATIDVDGGGDYIIEGEGVGTVIDCAGDRSAFSITSADSCHLKNFKIDANDITTEDKQIISVNVIGILIENIWIVGNGNKGHGIELLQTEGIVRGCHIDSLYHGVVLSNDLCIVEDCVIKNSVYAGVFAELTGIHTILSNRFYNCGNGIALITASIGSCIIGNNIYNGGGSGIRLWSGQYNTITGNNIYDIDIDHASSFGGIHLISTSDFNTISGNVIHGCSNAGAGTFYGIYIQNAECDDNIISGNILNGNDSPYLNNGTGTIIIQGGWSGWVDDGVNFRETFVDGILTAVGNSIAGGHNP